MSEPRTPARDAAAFASSLNVDDLDDDALEHAIEVIVDSLAAIVGGADAEGTGEYATHSADRYPGRATILGTNLASSTRNAALANGIAGTALELDEGHKFSAGHPAMHVLPAVLAESEVGNQDGETFVTAFVAGYEIAARAGIASRPLANPYHMHGIWGTVGGAAGVARLREFDTTLTLRAMRIAANHALHTRFDTGKEGATFRNAYAGMSNMNAIIAADQAETGLTALADGIPRHLDRVSTTGFDVGALGDALGDRWEVTRGYFKCHAACRYSHGALDAVVRLQRDHDLQTGDLESVHVETYEVAATLDDPRPKNALAAKFSIPFAVASRFRQGHSRRSAFESDALTEATFEIAERVSVEASVDIEARVPETRSTRVTVTTTNGEELEAFVKHARGDPRNPFSNERLREKYHALADPVLGRDRAINLHDAARGLPETNPRTLTDLGSFDD
jgi:2-methylcitrate dehydratase PrpD